MAKCQITDVQSGITLSSWFQDRYGYRRTLQISLVLLTGFLFIVFYAPSPAVIFVGQASLSSPCP